MLQGHSSFKKLTGAIALVLSAVLVVAMACGGGDETPTKAAATTAPATAVPATAAPAPTATTEPAGGGTLIVANDLVGPKVFRPSLITGGAHSAFGLQDWGFYDFLLQADHSNPLNFGEVGTSGMATAWTVAEDQSEILFTIRSDAEFHCDVGGAVGPEDIVHSFMESMGEGTKSTRGPGIKRWAPEWEVVDDNTVRAIVGARKTGTDVEVGLG